MQQLNTKRPSQLRTSKKVSGLVGPSQVQVSKQNSQKQLYSPLNIKQIASVSDLDSPTRRKNNLTFITQRKSSQVQIVHKQLNSYIDDLDNKVAKLIQKHEGEFLVAYRNHIKKVREQMEQIRNKALNNANSTVSQTEKIQALQKQLTIFRQQSLKLFQKVNQKQKTIYHLKIKMNELETQKSFLQTSLRSLTKRNKQLQGFKYEQLRDKSNVEQNTQKKQFMIMRPPQGGDTSQLSNLYTNDFGKTAMTFSNSRPYTTAINSKTNSVRIRNHHSIQINRKNLIGEFLQQKQQIFKKIDTILKNVASEDLITYLKTQIAEIIKPRQNNNEAKDLSKLNETAINIRQKSRSIGEIASRKSSSKSYLQIKNQTKKSELEEYFMKSIEIVRKQITRRRGLKSMNFYSEYANLSLAQFKKVDFFRLLELLLSKDEIIEAVHTTIFGNSNKFK